MSLPPGLSFASPAPGWARTLADFDARAFGRDAWPFEQWVQELASRRSVYIAIVREGGIAAVPEAEVLTVAVSRKERGRGLGGALLDELLARAREGGAEDVFLEVRSRDPIAQKLYSGRGFAAVGLRKGYYGDDDALVMRLRTGETSRGQAGAA